MNKTKIFFIWIFQLLNITDNAIQDKKLLELKMKTQLYYLTSFHPPSPLHVLSVQSLQFPLFWLPSCCCSCTPGTTSVLVWHMRLQIGDDRPDCHQCNIRLLEKYFLPLHILTPPYKGTYQLQRCGLLSCDRLSSFHGTCMLVMIL